MQLVQGSVQLGQGREVGRNSGSVRYSFCTQELVRTEEAGRNIALGLVEEDFRRQIDLHSGID